MARFGSKRIIVMEKWIFFIIAGIVIDFGFGYDFRLPNNVVPEHYNIKILTDLSDKFHYNGEVCIEFIAKEATNKIVLHSKNLKIFENETKLEEVERHEFFDKITRKPKLLNSDDLLENSESVLKLTAFKNKKTSSEKHKGSQHPSIAFDRYETFEKEVTSAPESDSNHNVPQKIINIEENSEASNNKAPKPADSIHRESSTKEKHPEVTSTAAYTKKENKATTGKPDYETFDHSSTPKGSKYSEKSTTLPTTPDDRIHFETPKPQLTTSQYLSTSKHGSTGVPHTETKRPVTFSQTHAPTVAAATESSIHHSAHPSQTPTHASHFSASTPTQSATYSPQDAVTHPTTFSSVHKVTHSSHSTQKLTSPTPATHASTHGSTHASASHETYAIVELSSTTHAAIIPPVIGFTHPVKNTQEDVHDSFGAIKHEFDLENDFLKVHLNRPLTPGQKYRLYLKYTGVLTDTLTGFHRVPYVKRGSQKSTWLASTVFEPNEARTAFPCFDEPALKATFDVTLGHEKKYTALSNMPIKSKSPVEGKPDWQWSEFETTPRMSTYLVAFLISDLEYLTPRVNYSESGPNVTYRFWSRHDVLYKTRYAMRIAPEMKNYLENLLEVKDVLPKHDFVALPSFISSALENWGLYSFAEKNLLFTPGFSSLFSKYEITHVVGHEIAHIWFGNMVTPKWWDQIWLSEGFSNFFEIIAADHIQPTWDLKTISVIYSYLKVFTLDALHTSHPLVPKLSHPNDLNEIFDSISYQKGFYLVRMLNYTLGQETFMNGVRRYLKTYHLSNADENDLWDVLTECAHQENTLPAELHLKDVMYPWTRRTGYPIIDVYRDYENNTANVTQRRFLRSKDDYEFRDNSGDYEGETKWWIPLTYTTGSELNFRDYHPRTWLSPKEEYKILTDMPSRNDFVLMNLDAAGLYRVNYDERNWALIISYLINENSSDISVINRVQILDDLLDLARAGEISYGIALDATSYLVKERHFLPWKAALSNFDFISRMLRSTDSSKTFKKFMRTLVAPRFEELGFESARNEHLSDGFNRKQIAKWACKTGLRQCTRKSISLFKKWTEEKKPDEHNPIPSSLRSVVYCTAIENGGSKDWQFLWQRYLSNVVTDKTAVLYGLGCSKSTRTLRKYLDWSIKESSGIKKQDVPIVFKSVAKNDVGFNLAKNFLKERMGDIRAYLGNNPFYLPQMIDTVAAKMNQPADLEELEELEQVHFSHQRSVPKSFRQAAERVRFNIDWLEKNYRPITDWLKRQKY